MQGAPKISDGFWNLKTNQPAMRHFHTDRHHVQWSQEFELVSAPPRRGTGSVFQNAACCIYKAWFLTAVAKTWCH